MGKQDGERIEHCQLCGASFRYGPGTYDGKFIPGYKITVCMSCFRSNADGWAPHHEVKLLALLEANEIQPPARNSRGLFPRE